MFVCACLVIGLNKRSHPRRACKQLLWQPSLFSSEIFKTKLKFYAFAAHAHTHQHTYWHRWSTTLVITGRTHYVIKAYPKALQTLPTVRIVHIVHTVPWPLSLLTELPINLLVCMCVRVCVLCTNCSRIFDSIAESKSFVHFFVGIRPAVVRLDSGLCSIRAAQIGSEGN